MNRGRSLILTVVLALTCLAALATAQVTAQAKPVDMKKLITEIVGEYQFDSGGQSLIVQFTDVDGKLFGAPPGETPEEIHPVEGKPLFFDITLAESGQYYGLQFVRNDKGVIDKCIMTVGSMVIEGMKLIK